VRGLRDEPLPLFLHAEASLPRGGNAPPPDIANEPDVTLPAMSLGEQVVEDYATLGLSLKRHPAALLRPRLAARGIMANERLAQFDDGARVVVSGLVLVRQRPGTASGVIFATLEDETGIANIVIWNHVYKRFRRILLGSKLLGVAGKLQKVGKDEHVVVHVVAEHLIDLNRELETLGGIEADFDGALAYADEVRKSGRDARTVMPQGRNFH
jgi:error-prone DNA polymerase